MFVYLWLLFSLAVYLIHSFRPAYLVPDNLGLVCIQVLGIFFGSKASKIICENIRKGGGTADADRKALRHESGKSRFYFRVFRGHKILQSSGYSAVAECSPGKQSVRHPSRTSSLL